MLVLSLRLYSLPLGTLFSLCMPYRPALINAFLCAAFCDLSGSYFFALFLIY